MEGYKPEKNKNSWTEGLKAASLAAGLSALPITDNPAEAQRVAPIENKYEARAEGVRESVGRVKKADVYDYTNSYTGKREYGLQFMIVLEDEGVVEAGIDLPLGAEIPFQQGEQITVKYQRDEGLHNSFEIIEIRTEDGKIYRKGEFLYG